MLGCVLLVQSVLTAWAAAAMPTPQLDIFGNPLCISDQSHVPDDGGKSQFPPCCTIGCSLASSVLPAPELAVAPIAWDEAAELRSPRSLAEGIDLRPTERPGRPRDPPTLPL